MNLLKNIGIARPLAGVVAGTTDQNGSSVDMSGYEGVLFIFAAGALTATQVTTLKAQQSSDNDVADSWADIAGSQSAAMGDGDGDGLVVLDIYKPTERYVRPVVERGTANAVIDGVIAIQYGARKAPITQGSDVISSELLISPAEGTASA